MHEQAESADGILNDVVCVREHCYIHEEVQIKEPHAGKHWKLITPSACKNNVNAPIGGIAMLLRPHTYKALNSGESTSLRVIVTTFNGKSQTTIICCYSPTDKIEEAETETFYDELWFYHKTNTITQSIVTGGDFNVHFKQVNHHIFAYCQ